jgi:hypothetical protein
VFDVVERQYRVEEHEAGFVFVCLSAGEPAVLPGLGERRLEGRRGVVADEADRAAGEPREARHERGAELGHQPAERRHERVRRLRRDARAIDRGLALTRAQHQERVFAEEGIARDLLAALDALEQEGVVRVLGDFQKRGDRRQQVGDDFLDDGHERAPARQVYELFERCLLHKVRVGTSETRSIVAALDRAAAEKTPAGGRWPVQSSN